MSEDRKVGRQERRQAGRQASRQAGRQERERQGIEEEDEEQQQQQNRGAIARFIQCLLRAKHYDIFLMYTISNSKNKKEISIIDIIICILRRREPKTLRKPCGINDGLLPKQTNKKMNSLETDVQNSSQAQFTKIYTLFDNQISRCVKCSI